MLKSKRIKETKREGQPKGQKYRRYKIPKGRDSVGTFPKGQKKEGEEKNSSLTQVKWGRREKSSLTTQENFWCLKLWGMRALFIGEEVDGNGKMV